MEYSKATLSAYQGSNTVAPSSAVFGAVKGSLARRPAPYCRHYPVTGIISHSSLSRRPFVTGTGKGPIQMFPGELWVESGGKLKWSESGGSECCCSVARLYLSGTFRKILWGTPQSSLPQEEGSWEPSHPILAVVAEEGNSRHSILCLSQRRSEL